MSEDIRKMIDKVKNFKQFVNENYENYKILHDVDFIKRVPFFKSFENNSDDKQVRFNHYKNWQGNDQPVLHYGKGNGFVKFQFLSIETKFTYYTIRSRDFDSESKLTVFKPMFKTLHYFIYSTDIHMKFPELDDIEKVPKEIVALMFKEIMKENLKFQKSFEVKDNDTISSDKLDNIINNINKNCFKIEETLGKMNLNYF